MKTAKTSLRGGGADETNQEQRLLRFARNDHSDFRQLREEIEFLKESALYRELKTLEIKSATEAVWNGKTLKLFCGNDYLGLSKHPRVIESFINAAKKYGVGSGAARLISGTSDLHILLEERIAKFKRKERALVFSTGYLANLGIISALCEKGDVVIIDKLNHASIVDACRLSGAAIRVYPHKDMNYLEKILKQATRFRRKLIITDSVFSMDGDLAPLPEIVELKNHYGAMLMIDEAHGTGVFGKHGRGAAEHFGVEDDIDISMGTLSKAIGTLGGFVTAKNELIDFFINRSRPFIFSTALPPAICAASITSLDLIENKPQLRETLWSRAGQLNDGLRAIGSKLGTVPELLRLSLTSPIIPILIGDAKKAIEVSEALLLEGILIPAIRYPTVPKNKARLRATVSAAHTPEDIQVFLSRLAGIISGQPP